MLCLFGSLCQYCHLEIVPASHVSVSQLCAPLAGSDFTLFHIFYDLVISLVQDSDLESQLPSPHPLRRHLAKGPFINHLREPLLKKNTLLCMSNII